MFLKYSDINHYLYKIEEEVSIPFIFEGLKDAMLEVPSVEHPYFKINHAGVTVSIGYAWDGATNVIQNNDSLIVPSLIHDIGCQAINLGLIPFKLRESFDREYYEQSLLYGVNPLRAMFHFTMLNTWRLIRNRPSKKKQFNIHELEIKSN